MTRLVLALGAALGLVLAPAAARWAEADAPVVCGALQVISVDGFSSCSHGPDPAPDGVDFRVPVPLQSSTPSFTAAAVAPAGKVHCYGDGTSGKRVQALYVRPADAPNRAAQVVPNIKVWAAQVDDVFDRSAARGGANRHVRFVTTPDCQLDVKVVQIPADADARLETMIAALALQGYNRSDRKYLAWTESTVLCGIANFYLDDRPTADNANNGLAAVPGTVARIDSGCWGMGGGRGQSVEAHELVHALGGVQPSAPHATVLGHCNDETDRMCYDDGSPAYRASQVCDGFEALLDCKNDDYFDARPTSTGYLATHWNTARSAFLETSAPAPVPGGDVTRVAGPDRVATAVAASVEAYGAGTAAAAVLSTDRAFADALAGVPLANAKGGPLLLTPTARLDDRVAGELRRVLRPKGTVYLLGGQAALGDAVASSVRALGYPVVRYGGANRFATAVTIAEQGLGSPSLFIEATGLSFADALAGGAAAAEAGGAVLLTNGSAQAVETALYIAQHPAARRVALGGPAASADPLAERMVGADRYATATLVAKAFFPAPTTVGIASGRTFPDALAGGANIARHEGPVLLSAPDALPGPLSDYVRTTVSVKRSMVYGGPAAVSDTVAARLAQITAGRK